MARVTIYLNFDGNTREAFEYYKGVFGTEYVHDFVPFGDNAPSEKERDLVMHVALEILGGAVIMGTDAPESMGFKLIKGNNIYINLEPDTKAEADELFARLSDGGRVEQALIQTHFGYFGSCADKFGVQWMFNVAANPVT